MATSGKRSGWTPPPFHRSKAAVAENRTVHVTTPAGTRFFLGKMSLEQLLALERTRPVFVEPEGK